MLAIDSSTYERMTALRVWINLAIYLFVTLTVCEASVTLEIFFLRYCNPSHQESNGMCCVEDCRQNCSSRISVCLQRMSDKGNTCSLDMESFLTTNDDIRFERNSILGMSNSRNLSNPLRFNINETNFRVRLRITNDEDNKPILSHHWDLSVRDDITDRIQNETHMERRSKTLVILLYNLRCSENYYGPDCSIYCVGADDETGHFRCDKNGNVVCLKDYTKASSSDQRCTKCVSEACSGFNLKTDAIVQASMSSANNSRDTSSSTLSSGGVAGIVITILILLALIVGGAIGGLLLVMYRPWSDDFKEKRARASSNSKSLNNPVYERETFTPPTRGSQTVVRIGMDGAADLRDRSISGHARVAKDDSNPLYSSKDSIAEGSKKNVEESMFTDNQSLVFILDSQHPTAKPQATQAHNGAVPLVNPNASNTDGLPSPKKVATDAVDCPQDFVPQFDDETYEDVSASTN